MSENFSVLINRIRRAAHADGPYNQTTYNVLNEICGDTNSTFTQMFDKMCDLFEYVRYQELEQERKSEYSRGYRDGQRSMDAEHYAVALRLTRLPLDEDSHGNLAQIARAVWHADFGWTQGACRALRDELVRLLGGVAGETCTMLVSDELEDERNDAVCRLKLWEPDEDGMPHRELWEAVMGKELPTVPLKGDAELDIIMRDRLIYLLSGDDSGRYSDPISPDCVENRQDAAKRGDLVTQNDGTASITGELREWARTFWGRGCKSKYGTYTDTIFAIAEHIDAEHAKQCRLLDDSWQATCEQLMKDYESEIAELRAAIVGYKERAAALEESERLRHELQAKLDEYDQTHMELPKDADGEHIHVGDRLWYGSLSDIVSYVTYEPNAKWLKTSWSIGTKKDEFEYEKVDGGPLSNQPHLLTHRQPPDPIEQLVTQHTLGNLDEQQLIDQLREVMNGRD